MTMVICRGTCIADCTFEKDQNAHIVTGQLTQLSAFKISCLKIDIAAVARYSFKERITTSFKYARKRSRNCLETIKFEDASERHSLHKSRLGNCVLYRKSALR